MTASKMHQHGEAGHSTIPAGSSQDAPAELEGKMRYRKAASLGRGSFGEVFSGTDVVTGDAVALKRIFLRRPEDGIPANVLREYMCLRQLEHPHVMRLLDVYPAVRAFQAGLDGGQHVVMALELCHTDLHQILRNTPHVLPPPVVKRWMQELLRGLAAVHGTGLIHRDVKPCNVMLSSSGAVKLADFGLARPAARPGRTYSHTVPSQWYRAPELLFGAREYDGAAVDMWSAGCVLAELLGKVPLFNAASELEQLACVIEVLGTYDATAWQGATALPDFDKVRFGASNGMSLARLLPGTPPDALDLLSCLFRYDPAQRPSAQDALEHAYFSSHPAPASGRQLQHIVGSVPAEPREQPSLHATPIW